MHSRRAVGRLDPRGPDFKVLTLFAMPMSFYRVWQEKFFLHAQGSDRVFWVLGADGVPKKKVVWTFLGWCIRCIVLRILLDID